MIENVFNIKFKNNFKGHWIETICVLYKTIGGSYVMQFDNIK